MFNVSQKWKSAFPGAFAGILVLSGTANPAHCNELEKQKEDLQIRLRTRFSGQERSAIEALPVIQAYTTYYKRFKKSYHVQFQLESVALKGKSLPGVAALVEAMFMAELKNQILTAGHDLDTLALPITLDVSSGTESYTLLRGQAQQLKPGDMFMADGQGVISSIIYGPDQRTQITSPTHRALFAAYAPPGIGRQAVYDHLKDIQAYALWVSPTAVVEMLDVFGAE